MSFQQVGDEGIENRKTAGPWILLLKDSDATARNEPTLYHPVIVRLTPGSLHSVPGSFNRTPA